jgi:ribonuclease HI
MNGQRKLKAITRAANDYIGTGRYWMKSKFTGGRCSECKSRIVKSEWIWRDTLASRYLCKGCRRVEDPSDRPPSKANRRRSRRESRTSTSSALSQPRAPRLVKQRAASIEPQVPAKPQTSQAVPVSDGKYVGYFDGACEPNPGRMGIGATLLKGTIPIDSISKNCGTGTNNIAEWKALIALLELAVEHDVQRLEVCGDSMLVMKQVQGQWGIKAAHLRQYKIRAAELIKRIGAVQFTWIPGDDNYLADELSRACL